MLNLICMVDLRPTFFGEGRTRLDCEKLLIAGIRRGRPIEHEEVYIANTVTHQVHCLNVNYVKNVEWMTKGFPSEGEFYEKAWSDRKHRPMTLTIAHQERMVLKDLASFVNGIVEDDPNTPDETLRNDVKSHLNWFYQLVGISPVQQADLRGRVEAILRRGIRKLKK